MLNDQFFVVFLGVIVTLLTYFSHDDFKNILEKTLKRKFYFKKIFWIVSYYGIFLLFIFILLFRVCELIEIN
jgi:hypothetical protein